MKNLMLLPLAPGEALYCFELSGKNMKLYFRQHQIPWDREHFIRSLQKGIAKIIWFEGQRAGFFHWKIKDHCGYVSTIQLESHLQGKGIGRFILQHLEHLTQEQDLDQIRLSVFVDNPALRLYQRLGYEIIGTKSDKYLMQKSL